MTEPLTLERTCWHILTCEYPPTIGGVSDYTAQVAESLAKLGDSVHVWCASKDARIEHRNGVEIHWLEGNYGTGFRRALSEYLNLEARPYRILVQYAPHGFGLRAMNLPFCWWLWGRKRKHKDDVRVMFHEVAYPWVPWPLHHNLIAIVNRWMARLLILAAQRIYVSTGAWKVTLTSLGAASSKIQVLPVPSNVPRADSSEAKILRDSTLGVNSQTKLVGHFGTYGKWIGNLLLPILQELLKDRDDVHLLLIGVGSSEFRDRVLNGFANWSDRVTATGCKELAEIALHIASCDVMLQPYSDGANTRRGSLMGCLINGKAVLTNLGVNSETLWSDSGIAHLVDGTSPSCYSKGLSELLNDAKKLKSIEYQAQAYYDREFSIQNTVGSLRHSSN